MRLSLLGAAVALAVVPGNAFGGDFSWNNALGGSFGVASNWTPAGPPGSTDRAIFQLPGTCTISFEAEYTNDRVLADGGSVIFDLGSGTYTLLKEADASGVSVHLAETQNATLTVLNGNVLAKDTSIGRYHDPGHPGGQLVVGSGARWTAFEHFITTGDTGDGSLSIQDGGIVEHGHGWAGANPDIAGTITVTGSGSQWYVTGWYGLGTSGTAEFNVSDQGLARIAVCEIATNGPSSGRAVVDGARFNLLSSEEVCLFVGKAGVGTVIVRNGGSLQSDGHVHLGGSADAVGSLIIQDADSQATIAKTLVIGVAGGAKGTVEVTSAGSLNVTGRGAGDPSDHVGLEVGREGEGTLNVLAGGYVSSDYITTIGAWTGGVGYALVDGDNSVLQANLQLEVGRSGTGTLTIQNGGRVSVTQDNPDPIIGSKGLAWVGGAGRGDIFVTGTGSGGEPSLLETAAQIQIGVHSIGYLVVSDGALVTSLKATSLTSSSGIIGAYADGEGTVTIQDPGSRWIQDGTLNVGMAGKGTLRIENGGAVESAGGCIGRSAGSSGTATIGGEGSTWELSDSLFLAGADTTPSVGSAGRLVIHAGGTVNVPGVTRVWNGGRIDYNGGSFSAGTLDVLGGGMVLLASGSNKTLVTTAITTDAPNGSKLDLADNQAIVDYEGDSPVDSLRQQIQSGCNGGLWDGGGITSSSAASDLTKALGYGEASELDITSFGGYDVDATAVLIKYTWEGDANLDGTVNVLDLVMLAHAWQTNGLWADGDFDYSGFVDAHDLGLMALNWQAGIGAPLGEALDELGLPAIVPESSFGLGFAFLFVRRRRTVSV